MSLLSLILNPFKTQERDPRRYSEAIPYIPNFHGELEGRKKGATHVNDRVRIDESGRVTFSDNSGFSGIDIPSTLTDKDIKWLKKKRLDPTNPAYQKAKAHFSANPGCSKEDLADASGIGTETAKDVVAGFRKNI